MELEGRVALVTGASSGIGRALAERLAAAGATVLAAGRDAAALDALAGRSGARPLVADLLDPGAAERLAALALEAAGRVDVLVNNAGAGWAGPFAAMDPAAAARLVGLNLLAPVRLTRALVPQMLARRSGQVVNVASIAGLVPAPAEAVYAATKAGLIGFSDSLRAELAPAGVGVLVVAPGVVDTPFFDRRGAPYARRWPRPIDPARVADATVAALRAGRAEVLTPAWLTVPARLHGALPGLYRRLAARFGG